MFAVAEAGELLAWARRKKKTIAGLPDQVRPRGTADAYAVQTDMARRLHQAGGALGEARVSFA